MMISSYAWAGSFVFSNSTSQDSLRILKRMEYKENIPNGMLHAISLVETNIGQTGKYRPWPYTIRLNSYKSDTIEDVDMAFDLLDSLVDLGYQNFDVKIDGELFYSLSAYNLEDTLNNSIDSVDIQISARSVIKYFKNKSEAKILLSKLLERNWFDFKIGIMQLSYQVVSSNMDNISDALNAYENINLMIGQLKKIRKAHSWWESVGLYHSKKQSKAKRYVKNVWAMYQRVHKIKVR